MVRNIIEDSDDEGDFGALSPVSRPSSPTPPDAPNRDASTPKAAPGTSSTEELRRDIAAAHKDVIDKSALSDGTANSANGSDRWSSPVASRKRKPTLSGLENNGTPPAKKSEPGSTPKAYRHSDRRGHDFFDTDNNTFDAMREEETDQHSGYNGPPSQPNETSQLSAETWCLVGNKQAVLPEMSPSLQEDFVLHDPTVMFPTTMSSTVPDATANQQQLVDAARAEYRQNQLSSPGPAAKIIENPSVSWSDRLYSTEKDMRSSQIDPAKSQQQSQSKAKRNQSADSQTSREDRALSIGNEKLDSSASVGSKRSTRRSKMTLHLRLSQSSQDELGHDTSSAELTSSSKRRKLSIDGKTASQKAIDESVEESIRAVRASKTAKAKFHENSATLDSDGIAIGLPKERYVPRPSRSRSTRSTVEEPDYSVVPEKAAKARKRYQKTAKPLPEDLNEVGPVDDGNLGNQSLQEGSDGGPGQFSGENPTADRIEDRTPKNTSTKGKRRRGRPPKNAPKGAMEIAEADVNGQHNARLGDVDELQQGIPLVDNGHDVDPHIADKEQLLHDPNFTQDASRPRLPSPFVQPTPTRSARNEVAEESEMQQVETKAKKKGRGRPRSVQNIEFGTTNVDEPQTVAGDPSHDENVKSQETLPDTSMKEKQSNGKAKAARGGAEANGGAPSDAAAVLGSCESSEQPSEEHEVGKSVAGQRAAASRESAQPSPVGKGKVPVRVGLSRRARIAPLLKVVKK